MIEPRVVTIDSKKPWKHTIIMWWIHGDEKSWFEVIERLIKELIVDTWKVTLIQAHLEAKDKNQRQIEENLNRCFGVPWTSLEHILARHIEICLDQADCLLDIHNTVKNESPRFTVLEEPKLAKLFNVDKATFGLLNMYGNSSCGYMVAQGKEAITLEAGWTETNPVDNMKFAYDAAINFLKYTKNIQQEEVYYEKPEALTFDYLYRNSWVFTVAKAFRDFTELKEGDLIGMDGDMEVRAQNDGYLLFANNYSEPNSECFLFGHKEKAN